MVFVTNDRHALNRVPVKGVGQSGDVEAVVADQHVEHLAAGDAVARSKLDRTVCPLGSRLRHVPFLHHVLEGRRVVLERGEPRIVPDVLDVLSED